MSATAKKPPPKYSSIPIVLVFDKNLKHTDTKTYAYIKWRQGRSPDCWPSIERIARDLHMSTSTVQLSLQRLIDRGWIVRRYPKVAGEGNSCHYSVVRKKSKTTFEQQLEAEKAQRLKDAGNV